MDKKTLQKIIDKAEEYYLLDEKIDKASKEFYDVVSPESYAPIMNDYLWPFLDCLSITNEELVDPIKYYFYECLRMKDWWLYFIDGVDYKIQNKQDITDFIYKIIIKK